jgi:sirohydrochlorin cobaltochelatase
MSRALLLFAHGARDPRWAAPFEAVAAALRTQQPGLAVQLAYLELMAPDMAAGGAALVAGGATRIDIVPMFLGAGGHVRKDLPVLVDALRAAHPGVAIELHPAIGEQAAVIEAMAAAIGHRLGPPSPEGPR